MGPSRFAGDGGRRDRVRRAAPYWDARSTSSPRYFVQLSLSTVVSPSGSTTVMTPGVWSCAVTPRARLLGWPPAGRPRPASRMAAGLRRPSARRPPSWPRHWRRLAPADDRRARQGRPSTRSAIARDIGNCGVRRWHPLRRCPTGAFARLPGVRDGSGQLGGWGRVTRTVATIRGGARAREGRR